MKDWGMEGLGGWGPVYRGTGGLLGGLKDRGPYRVDGGAAPGPNVTPPGLLLWSDPNVKHFDLSYTPYPRSARQLTPRPLICACVNENTDSRVMMGRSGFAGDTCILYTCEPNLITGWRGQEITTQRKVVAIYRLSSRAHVERIPPSNLAMAHDKCLVNRPI